METIFICGRNKIETINIRLPPRQLAFPEPEEVPSLSERIKSIANILCKWSIEIQRSERRETNRQLEVVSCIALNGKSINYTLQYIINQK